MLFCRMGCLELVCALDAGVIRSVLRLGSLGHWGFRVSDFGGLGLRVTGGAENSYATDFAS